MGMWIAAALVVVLVALLVAAWLRTTGRTTAARGDIALDSTGTRVSPSGQLGTPLGAPVTGPELGAQPVESDVPRLPEPEGPAPPGAQWDERRGVWIRWDEAAGAWVDVDGATGDG